MPEFGYGYFDWMAGRSDTKSQVEKTLEANKASTRALVNASILKLAEYPDESARLRSMGGFNTGQYKVKKASGEVAYIFTLAEDVKVSGQVPVDTTCFHPINKSVLIEQEEEAAGKRGADEPKLSSTKIMEGHALKVIGAGEAVERGSGEIQGNGIGFLVTYEAVKAALSDNDTQATEMWGFLDRCHAGAIEYAGRQSP